MSGQTRATNAASGATKTALIMAGGTGGHIFPGLAMAEGLRTAGWNVVWLGAPGSMEARLVPAHDIPLETIDFSGVRGKGIATLLALPWRLGRALRQSWQVLSRVRPDVVMGFGGYISFPAGIVASLRGHCLFLHEQNSVAGTANKILARFASKTYTAFPQVLKGGVWVGNPLRKAFLEQENPRARYLARQDEPLRVLVLGGSLGAAALNEIVPRALSMIAPSKRPIVVHQSGEKQIAALRENYARENVEATLLPFIDDTAKAMAEADVVIARAGASTVCEIAAVGVAALFVPFPYATDDHQRSNAQYLIEAEGAKMVLQDALRAEDLAAWLANADRKTLLNMAEKAHAKARKDAVLNMVQGCEEAYAGSAQRKNN